MERVKAVLWGGPACGLEIEVFEDVRAVHVARPRGLRDVDRHGRISGAFVADVYLPTVLRTVPGDRIIFRHAPDGLPGRSPVPPGPGRDGARS